LGRRPKLARWGRRSAWAASIGCIAGCAQVIGVGGYGPERDAADPPVDDDASVDAQASMAFDADGTDDTAAAVANSPKEAGASSDASPEKTAMRDAAAETKDAHGSASGDPPKPPPIDASTNAPANYSAADAAVEAATGAAVDAQPPSAPPPPSPPSPGACPSQCSGGCALGTCVIGITGGGGGNIDCPANLPCDVQCHGDKACRGVVNCAAGQLCQVECNGNTACTNWPLSGVIATSLCVDCSTDADHSGTCHIACIGPGCKPSCN
jgi:hypothetical protein